MTLQEIEKLRIIYNDLKMLWNTPALAQYSGQPLQSLSEIIEQAVWDRHNASVEKQRVVSKNNTTVMIEIPISLAKYRAYKNDDEYSEPCRKALEQLKNWSS